MTTQVAGSVVLALVKAFPEGVPTSDAARVLRHLGLSEEEASLAILRQLGHEGELELSNDRRLILRWETRPQVGDIYKLLYEAYWHVSQADPLATRIEDTLGLLHGYATKRRQNTPTLAQAQRETMERTQHGVEQ